MGRQLYGSASLFSILECTERTYEPEMQQWQFYVPLPDDEMWTEWIMNERGSSRGA